eukprot:6669571-Alexandrium_andersonii.AAC.1
MSGRRRGGGGCEAVPPAGSPLGVTSPAIWCCRGDRTTPTGASSSESSGGTPLTWYAVLSQTVSK